jgi:hypothetical protein
MHGWLCVCVQTPSCDVRSDGPPTCWAGACALNEWYERVNECRVCGRSPCFLDDCGDKYPPSWVTTWCPCDVACMWSLHLQVETAVDITRNVMGTHRRTQYHPCLQIPWDLVIIVLADCVSFTHVGLWNMCLSGLRGTSIPVKQGWTELSPERGFKMTSEELDPLSIFVLQYTKPPNS